MRTHRTRTSVQVPKPLVERAASDTLRKEDGAIPAQEFTEKPGIKGKSQEEMLEKTLPMYLLIYFKGTLPSFLFQL